MRDKKTPSSSQTNPSVQLKHLQTIHWSMLSVVALFGMAAYAANHEEEGAWTWEAQDPLLYVPVIFLIIAMPFSLVVFRLVLRENMPKRNPILTRKMAAYQTAHLVRMAIIEIPAFLAAAICLVSGSHVNLVILLLAVLIMAYHVPTPAKLVTDLDLNSEDRDVLMP